MIIYDWIAAKEETNASFELILARTDLTLITAINDGGWIVWDSSWGSLGFEIRIRREANGSNGESVEDYRFYGLSRDEFRELVGMIESFASLTGRSLRPNVFDFRPGR